MKENVEYDVIVIGAGAAGLMAGMQAGANGNKALIIEHTAKIGEKIRISGGGRCNFTNINSNNKNFLCKNPHFVKSALSQYTQNDFINLVESYQISYHEKTLGQLFCNGSSKQIINMLFNECKKYQVTIITECTVQDISKNEKFTIKSNQGEFKSNAVIIATGGLSIPKIGASDFGYKIAKKFGHNIIPTAPALVPLTIHEKELEWYKQLRGISNHSIVSYNKTIFEEAILFTHKGLSGPAILQISSYMDKFENETVFINFLPHLNLEEQFTIDKNSKQTVANYLKKYLTNRLVDNFVLTNDDFNQPLTNLSKEKLIKIAQYIHNFHAPINGREGYLKAEVTSGGVDTNEISSKTMESKIVPNLYFIGEVVDVTGWLGGYNFQWAWSSGAVAGRSI